ncbi:hypothetical protein [Amycolatopsis sp. NBC_00438]|uniref:hypothetical protein n=1 Tax=Amycolatopsis sp. NBC_00438 TaxID=2903558 RepID=UPI002E1FA660
MSPEVTAEPELLFGRPREASEITVPAWCRAVYLAVVHEAALLPMDSPVPGTAASEVDARARVASRESACPHSHAETTCSQVRPDGGRGKKNATRFW